MGLDMLQGDLGWSQGGTHGTQAAGCPGTGPHRHRELPDLMLCVVEPGRNEKEPEQSERMQMCFHLAGPPRPNDVTPAKPCNMLAGGA